MSGTVPYYLRSCSPETGGVAAVGSQGLYWDTFSETVSGGELREQDWAEGGGHHIAGLSCFHGELWNWNGPLEFGVVPSWGMGARALYPQTYKSLVSATTVEEM